MPYNEKLAVRIREALAGKWMVGGRKTFNTQK